VLPDVPDVPVLPELPDVPVLPEVPLVPLSPALANEAVTLLEAEIVPLLATYVTLTV
jgi:hypothetical protein